MTKVFFVRVAPHEPLEMAFLFLADGKWVQKTSIVRRGRRKKDLKQFFFLK